MPVGEGGINLNPGIHTAQLQEWAFFPSHRLRPPPRRATDVSSERAIPWTAEAYSSITLHAGVRVSLARRSFVVLSALGGAGVLLYPWLWVMVPKDSGELHGIDTTVLPRGLEAIDLKRMHLTVRNQLLDAGILLILIILGVVILSHAGFMSIRNTAATLSIVLGIGLVWSQAGVLEQQRSIRLLASIISGAILLSLGILLFITRGDPPTILLRGGPIEAVTVAGVLFALASLWPRTSKDLSASQAQQIRDVEGAGIVAHLRDSVSQALTLIRASIEGPKRVRALASNEERKLRPWLYTDRSEAASSLAEAVCQSIGALENKFGIPAEVVTVSGVEPGPAEFAPVVALGEAVTNVLHHGSPPVSAYFEARTEKIEASIKDRGNGFDLDSTPRDRYGVRDPIIGRMERVGGKAHIRVCSSGTEIALEVPRKAENIPRDAPNITHDVSNIPHGVPNTQGAL